MADDVTRKSGEQNQAEGNMKDLGGRVQRAWGDLTDNPEHQVKGAKKQVEGKAQETIGEAQETIDDVNRR